MSEGACEGACEGASEGASESKKALDETNLLKPLVVPAIWSAQQIWRALD